MQKKGANRQREKERSMSVNEGQNESLIKAIGDPNFFNLMTQSRTKQLVPMEIAPHMYS
jgi:hypothetical protein